MSRMSIVLLGATTWALYDCLCFPERSLRLRGVTVLPSGSFFRLMGGGGHCSKSARVTRLIPGRRTAPHLGPTIHETLRAMHVFFSISPRRLFSPIFYDGISRYSPPPLPNISTLMMFSKIFHLTSRTSSGYFK